MSKKFLIILILFSLFFALFLHLDYPFLRGEEQRRAVVAIECHESGNYIVPQLLGETYYNKPPMFNWVLAGFIFATGSFSEWVIRLPGVLALVVISLVLYGIVSRYLGKETGILSSLFLLTSADIFFFAVIYAGEIDLFYSMLVFFQVISVFYYFDKKEYFRLFVISYLFAAFGLLTKGFPSIAFQAFTLLAVCIWYRRWKLLFGWQHFAGIAVFGIIVGGYFYWYSLYGDVWAYLGNLFKETSQRSANEYSIGEIVLTLFVFPLQLFKLILPWSVFILFAFGRGRIRFIRSNKLLSFIMVFLIPNLIVYWISPELRNRYLYMFLPFIVVLPAVLYVNFASRQSVLNLWIERVFGVFIMLLAFFFILFPFLKVLHTLEGHIVILPVIFSSVFLTLFVSYVRFSKQRIYLFILAVVMARIGHDYCVLPYLNNNYRSAGYVKQVETITAYTEGEPVNYYGKPDNCPEDGNCCDSYYKSWDMHIALTSYLYKKTQPDNELYGRMFLYNLAVLKDIMPPLVCLYLY